jgi:hypothetical protein
MIRTTVPTEVGEDNARFEPTGEPDEAKVSSPVRRGAAETGPHGNRADRPPYVRLELCRAFLIGSCLAPATLTT